MASDRRAQTSAYIRAHYGSTEGASRTGGACTRDWRADAPEIKTQDGGPGLSIVYKDIPLTCPSDLTFMTEKPDFLGPLPSYYSLFENACRGGAVATIQSALSLENYALTPAFFHHGLCLVLKAGNVEATRFCLDYGAPIIRRTTDHILEAPENRQVHLSSSSPKLRANTKYPSCYTASDCA
ncbi:hypothetical protein BDW69DRAFT_31508 [Aspergillus filifer]